MLLLVMFVSGCSSIPEVSRNTQNSERLIDIDTETNHSAIIAINTSTSTNSNNTQSAGVLPKNISPSLKKLTHSHKKRFSSAELNKSYQHSHQKRFNSDILNKQSFSLSHHKSPNSRLLKPYLSLHTLSFHLL